MTQSAVMIASLLMVGLVLLGASSTSADEVGGLKAFGTMGKAVYPLKGGKEAELYSHTGKGCLTHMWFGGKWKDYGKLRVRVYADGEKTASIDMELFLGHGIGFQDDAAPWGTRRIGKTGSPSGIYNTYRIPYGKRVRVTAQLPKGDKSNPRFWYIIRGTENLPVVLAGVKLPDKARLKLYKLEDHTVKKSLEEFDILKTGKSGMIYQVTVAGRSRRKSFLECCVRAYVGGSKKPLILSSGLEDYFLGTYYFNKGKYYTDVAGLTHYATDKATKEHSFSAYRFHEDDPIFYQNGLRLTLRNGEKTDRETWNSAPTTYTTYVWVYEW